MTNSTNRMERPLRLSGLLLILALLTEAICLLWARPLSFLVLVGVGGAFLGLGVVVYLFLLVSTNDSSEAGSS